MSDAAGIIVLAGRILIAAFFGAVAGVSHITRSAMMEQFAQSTKFPVPGIAGWPTGVWLIVAALSIAFGIWPDVGALMIAVFAIPAALYFHRFWAIQDEMQKMSQTQLFWRNVVIVGVSLIVFGSFVALGPDLRYAITTTLFDF